MTATPGAVGSQQRHVVAAAYLGWTLDAFDFFIMVFAFDDVAHEFGVGRPAVAYAITLTLATRALGAFLFGRLADRYGRRPTLMVDVVAYSVLEFATGFAPSLTWFLVLRALYGIAMGGEWGVGASLTMESIPARWRGPVSGLLQAGYPSGYLLASLLFGLGHDALGWRGMFMVGAVPALLVLYIRRHVPESPDWLGNRQRRRDVGLITVLRANVRLVLFATVMMAAFNFFSHGTQDLYVLVPAQGTRTAGRHGLADQRRRQRGRHARRHPVRHPVAAHRPALGHRHRLHAGVAGDPALGLFADRGDAGAWARS